MAHYNLYQRFSLNQNEDAATLAARLNGLLQSGSLSDSASEEEVQVALAVLGNEHTRRIYDTKLTDPTSPEITFDALRELANTGYRAGQEMGASTHSTAAAYPGDTAYLQSGNNQWAGSQQGDYSQGDPTSSGMQAPYTNQYGQQYQQYTQGYPQQNAWQNYQGYPGQYQQASFQQNQYAQNQYPGNQYAGQYAAYGQYPQMSGYPVNTMAPRDVHEQQWADPTYRNATTGARVGAYIIDALIVGIPISIISALLVAAIFAGKPGYYSYDIYDLYDFGSAMGSSLLLYIFQGGFLVLYKVLLEATLGRTLGKMIMGVRLISTDGVKMGFSHAVRRNGMLFFIVIPFLGSLIAGIDFIIRFATVVGSPYNQGYEDRWGHTRLIQK